MDPRSHQQQVADYYDHEACTYEERYWKNHVAQRIRQSFREEVKRHAFQRVLEVGCGTGLDLAHFGSIYPERAIYGIDISSAMVASTARKIEEQRLSNVRIKLGAPEDLLELFPDVRFDHIYVFFGALNTVANLQRVAGILRSRLQPDGTMVLTIVNKWYLAEVVINLFRLRPRRAFKRLRANWGGYSDVHQLDSRCFSPGEISYAFGSHFQVTRRQGYSILYPPWYRAHWALRLGRRLCDILWLADEMLNRTPAWCLGEYALYSFRTKR